MDRSTQLESAPIITVVDEGDLEGAALEVEGDEGACELLMYAPFFGLRVDDQD